MLTEALSLPMATRVSKKPSALIPQSGGAHKASDIRGPYMTPASKSLLSLIRSNRKALRLRGLTAADILTLEAVAALAPCGFRRLSVAAVGRMVGTGRQTSLRHIRRLEAAGALVRLGPALMVNARSVLKWCADAVRGRVETLKRLYAQRKSRCVTTRPTHRRQEAEEGGNRADEALVIPDRLTALADLRALWAAREARRRELRG